MTRSLSLLVLTLACSAQAAEWKDTFAPAAVATWFEGSKRSVLVVAAGEPLAEARLAATELEASLRACGKAALVMSGAGLKVGPADDDAQIVKQAAAQPVELVAVVRVFEGSAGSPSNAVVTLYDKAGAAQLAFSALKGRALSAHTGSGVDVKLPNSELAAAGNTESRQSREAREYEQKYLWFDQGASRDAPFSSAYQGRFRSELSDLQFYEVVGRRDLISAWSSRHSLKVSLILSGLLAETAAVLLLASELFNPCARVLGDPASSACLQRQRPSMVVPSLAVAGAGVVSFVVGVALHSNRLTQGEAEALADEYNARLKKGLGDRAQTEAAPPATPKLRLSPAVSPQGAGLALEGSF